MILTKPLNKERNYLNKIIILLIIGVRENLIPIIFMHDVSQRVKKKVPLLLTETVEPRFLKNIKI